MKNQNDEQTLEQKVEYLTKQIEQQSQEMADFKETLRSVCKKPITSIADVNQFRIEIGNACFKFWMSKSFKESLKE